MLKKVFAIPFYITSTLFICIYFIIEMSPYFILSEFGRMFLLCNSCLFLYFGGLLLSKYLKNNKPMVINLWMFFGLYLLLLITLTLFDPIWGRTGFNVINWFSADFVNYVKNSINLIPFKTIFYYIHAFDSLYSTRAVIFNLFGNLVAFMPLALFLPLLFKKQNKPKNFIVTIILIVLGIELTQLLTTSGIFDIDDLILNTLGTVIMYFILRIKLIRKIIGNIFLLKKNKVSKKDIIKLCIIIFLCVVLGLGIIKYRNKLYNQNFEEYMMENNPTINIIDKSEACAETLDEFYEDNLFKYYFTCMKSDDVYVVINDNEMYLVKDLLSNNTTEYNITVNKILDRLNVYEVDYVKQNKYEFISFEIDVPVYNKNIIAEPSQIVTIDNQNILDVEFDYSSSEMTINNKYTIDLYLIPKQVGKTNLTVEFTDKDTEKIINTYSYYVEVGEDLNVNFYEIK